MKTPPNIDKEIAQDFAKTEDLAAEFGNGWLQPLAVLHLAADVNCSLPNFGLQSRIAAHVLAVIARRRFPDAVFTPFASDGEPWVLAAHRDTAATSTALAGLAKSVRYAGKPEVFFCDIGTGIWRCAFPDASLEAPASSLLTMRSALRSAASVVCAMDAAPKG